MRDEQNVQDVQEDSTDKGRPWTALTAAPFSKSESTSLWQHSCCIVSITAHKREVFTYRLDLLFWWLPPEDDECGG
jgi:hypothetical protein